LLGSRIRERHPNARLLDIRSGDIRHNSASATRGGYLLWGGEMKIWITTGWYSEPEMVRVHTVKPHNSQCISDFVTHLCRPGMKELLEGTGKHLPLHGSKKIVEIELTAR
jgi:hypothetical protein